MYIAIGVFAQPRIGSILLKSISMVWIHSTAATVFNLCCVSVDRFIAIRFPFRYQDIITKQRCYAVIIMVWLISLFLPFSRILVDNQTNVEKLWFSLTFIVFILPLTVVSLCYFWIFKAARKQSREIRREIESSQLPRKQLSTKHPKLQSYQNCWFCVDCFYCFMDAFYSGFSCRLCYSNWQVLWSQTGLCCVALDRGNRVYIISDQPVDLLFPKWRVSKFFTLQLPSLSMALPKRSIRSQSEIRYD